MVGMFSASIQVRAYCPAFLSQRAHTEDDMHDIGSSQMGSAWGQEMPGEFEQEFEFMGGPSGEFGEFGEFGEVGGQFEGEFEFEAGVMSEMDEMALASELLSVSNDQELEYFLGGLLKKVAKAGGAFLRSGAGKALTGILRNAAKSALPIAGAALGNLVAPGIGGAIGGKLASMAGKAFGLELEGMSNEDREFEIARRIVRLSHASARNLARIPANVPDQAAARKAFMHAARQVAPGIINNIQAATAMGSPAYQSSAYAPYGGVTQCQSCGMPRSGRWIKRGKAIILLPNG
jgi:hypothetical protein